MSKEYIYPEMEGDFVEESVPLHQVSTVEVPVDYHPSLSYDTFKQECIASVRDAEEEYSRTGEAIDFEDMMAEFKQEFKW